MKKVNIAALFCVVISMVFWSNCSHRQTVRLYDDKPFDKLSKYGFFTGEMAELKPNAGVLPYDLNTPLFTDYAEKARFVWMPEGVQAVYNDTGAFEFPGVAVLIKNFYYHNDKRDVAKGKRILETRLLIHKNNKWEALTYVWNDEQTEAELQLAGGTADVSWVDEKGKQFNIQYAIPNKNQCKGCHNHDELLIPIGPKARNLNKTFAYADGQANQLDKWTSQGYLKGFSSAAKSPRMAVWDDTATGTLHERAMAYLEMNCGHCHNEHGPANTSGLTLMTTELNPTKLGVHKSPVAAGRGSGGHSVDILPGQPESSILLFRMRSNDPGIMMPELGRTITHTEGVELIREWIAEME